MVAGVGRLRSAGAGRRCPGPRCAGAALLLACGLLLSGPAAAATEVAGVELPETREARDGTRLALNGAGLRKKFLFRVYVGALYLAEAGGDAEAILERNQPARMEMHFLRGGIERDQINDAWREGVAANSPEAVVDAIADARDTFLDQTPAEIAEGDMLTVEYVPGDGTQLAHNGETRGGAVGGHNLFAALLSTWLGEEPPSSRLRAGVLGD